MRFEWTAAVDSAQITSAVNLQAASASLPAIQAALDVASEADQGRVTLDGAWARDAAGDARRGGH